MARKLKMIVAGNLVKVVLYTAPEPRDTPRARAEKSRMTSAAQKAMNDKTARDKLEMLLAENFKGRDLFLTLTYRDADLPARLDGAKKLVRKFLRNLREHYKARSLELRYIYTTEGKHGDHRLHHHLVINATERDIEVLRSLWPYGDIVDLEYIGPRGYRTVAEYMTKEGVEGRPVGAQMWTGSKNIRKPRVVTRYVPNGTTLETPLNCHILEKEEKRTEFGSYCYIKYYKIPNYWNRKEAQAAGEKYTPPPLLSYL